ncbi:MAG: 4Fe-4S ferredoxin [Desulfonatronovibrio sp. MSAO_Bac4]|nr:MAG: 4Fe-4S ferredoxin [Desulfonatronovibrio sp. MSAO_Bac4]
MVKRKIIQIDEELCNGCGECIVNCAEAALEIIDGKAKVVADRFCDGLGACMGHCPTGALTMVEREAEPFDEDAVHQRIKKLEKAQSFEESKSESRGCPSSSPMNFGGCPGKKASLNSNQNSVLPNWPVKLRLIPEDAPFLHDSHLFLTADCVPSAVDGLTTFLKVRSAVSLSCPKFEDYFSLTQKLSRMIAFNDIREITVMEMEVPCCSPLHKIALQSVEMAGKKISVNRLIVSRHGSVIKKQKFTLDPGNKALQLAEAAG